MEFRHILVGTALVTLLAASFGGCSEERRRSDDDDDGGGGAGGGVSVGGAGSGATGGGGGDCKPGGSGCQAFSECCSGECANQVCTDCAIAGQSCDTLSCCNGLTCYGPTGLCGDCLPDGDDCVLASDCCSNICDDGTCAPCHPSGTSCTQTAECCQGSCVEGMCTTCSRNGIACGGDSDCCSNVCSGGSCADCRAPGDSCQQPAECCSGLCHSGSCADLIDDLESGDGVLPQVNGRIGFWYTYNDGTGSQTPAPSGTALPSAGGHDSALAAHTSGNGFTTWGAGLGVHLNNDRVNVLPYNASAYTGVTFWARGNGAVRFKLNTTAITPPSDGGTCNNNCDDAHGYVVNLSGNWTQHTIAFSQLAQEGWGTQAAFDPATVLAMQFQTAANTTFDYRLDDIAFY